MVDVSVIIVTWNSSNVVDACVKSVISNSDTLNTELIFIDNNSLDNTYDKLLNIEFRNLQVYKNETNLGFTKAVNQGIRYSSGKYIMLLNPDTVLKPHCIDLLVSFLNNNENYSACSPLLLNEDGTIQQSVRNFPDYWTMLCEFSLLAYIFPKTKLFGKWKMKYFKYDKDEDVNQPMAAALMIRKTTLDGINNMDERFEMFFNDVDLCKQIIDSNSKIRFLKDPKVIHVKGESIYKDRKRMINVWNQDCVKYFEKHHNSHFLLFCLKVNLKLSGFVRKLFL